MNKTAFIYFLLAISYSLGRVGFLSSPDVFNKLRPNRHINIVEIAVSQANAKTTLIVLAINTHWIKHSAKKSPLLEAYNNLRINEVCLNNGSVFSYYGVYVDPPPLLL